jgi:hypothetical protein
VESVLYVIGFYQDVSWLTGNVLKSGRNRSNDYEYLFAGRI